MDVLGVTILQLVGLIGAGFYLGSYALLQLGLVAGSGYAYTLMNMTGAALVAISLVEDWNMSSAIIQAWFFGASLVGLIRMTVQNRLLKFTADELSFAAHAFPGLSRRHMRRLLDQGRWESASSGEQLAKQAEPVAYLVYIAEGCARVTRNGVTVAHIGPGNFVGEITYISGDPATGSVIVTERSLIFRIPVGRLRRFLAKSPEIFDQLERSLAADLRRKLNESAALLAASRKDTLIAA